MGRRGRISGQIATVVLGLVLAGAAGAAGAATRPAATSGRALSASSRADWRSWWGNVAFDAAGVTLSSTPPSSAAETHSALITSRQTWRDQTISVTTTTLAQLRTGGAPNTWEVGWVMFRFRDLSDYYYFILKPNGWELGKKQGSDAQIFLATGDLPALRVGQARRIQLRIEGARIRAFVDGTQVLDYTDARPLATGGAVGLYEEDSRVRFESLTVS